MKKQLALFGSDTMLLAVALWMCTVPIVAIILIPVFGVKIAAVAGLALFLVALLICWGVCGWKGLHG